LYAISHLHLKANKALQLYGFVQLKQDPDKFVINGKLFVLALGI